MKIKSYKNICLYFLVTLIILIPLNRIDALSPEWISVPESQYGKQLWDKNSLKNNLDGSIRVLSKFIPKSTTAISQDILYTMDINCSASSFRDVAVGAKEFNEFPNNDSEWKSPNGDKLILGVIDQVCFFDDLLKVDDERLTN